MRSHSALIRTTTWAYHALLAWTGIVDRVSVMNTTLSGAAVAISFMSAAAMAEPKGTFRQTYEPSFGALSSLDPISETAVVQITEKIMNRLVRPGLGGGVTPGLAESWSVSDDGTEWIFQLRNDVIFHDGTTFGAEDVVYSVRRVLNQESASAAWPAANIVNKVDVLDAVTVKFSLKGPSLDLPLHLTDRRLKIIPEGSGDDIGQGGIGTGPFKVKAFDAEGTTVLIANMDYWEGPPGVERMEIIGMRDNTARLQALLEGKVDMVRGIAGEHRQTLEGSQIVRVEVIPTGDWQGIVFRTDVAPFDDKRVRKAVRLVADRQEMIEKVESGLGVISCDTPVEPSDQFRADIDCPQDIEKAKLLLAEAGYSDGIDIKINVSPLEPRWRTMAEVYRQQAAMAGINVEIILVPTDGYWKDVWTKEAVSMTQWNERPADQILHLLYLSDAEWNESFMREPEFDAVLATAHAELDLGKRKELYYKAQEILWENTGTLVPYHVTRMVGVNRRVGNLDNVESDAVRWHLVTVN